MLKWKREMSTFSPFFIEIDDFIDYFNAGETTALRFADEFGVVTLFFPE
jgi:hypothetical protein